MGREVHGDEPDDHRARRLKGIPMKFSPLLAVLLGFSAILPGSVAAQAPAPAAAPQIAGPVLMVTDLERSIRFYTEGLGLQVASRLPGKPGPGAILTAPGTARTPFILLRQRSPDVRLMPPLTLGDGLSRVMIRVPDAAQAAARLKDAGYSVPDAGGKLIFFVSDPDGYRFEIMQITSGR
jgi:catechol 2,3-dioxygenase-like lactoylglutathione lyase family enzyme